MTTKTDLLAPFEIWEVPINGTVIKFHKPLILTPKWLPDDPDEPDDHDYLWIECPELDISSWSEDRDDLRKWVEEDIAFAWEHFVRLDDDQQTPATLRIKRRYMQLAEEINDTPC
ncbi:MAG: hypothetical protein ACRCUY_01530 [Thermoguttaceae bacterium]